MIKTMRAWRYNLCGLRLVRWQTIDLFSTTSLESKESYLTTGILPYQHISRSLENFSTCTVLSTRLYNAAASPASHLRLAGSLAISYLSERFYCPLVGMPLIIPLCMGQLVHILSINRILNLRQEICPSGITRFRLNLAIGETRHCAAR